LAVKWFGVYGDNRAGSRLTAGCWFEAESRNFIAGAI